MADWGDITDTEVQPGKPITTSLMFRLARNCQAIAERALGAPRVQPSTLERLTGVGNWPVPAGVTRVRVYLVAGGGGGGGGIGGGSPAAGGGGGGGGMAIFNLDVTPGDTIAYSCGAGGAAGSTGVTPTNGGVGGATTFGVGSQQASGGNGGSAATSGNDGAGANGGGFSGTSFGFKGQHGFMQPMRDGGVGHWNAGNGGTGGNDGSNGAAGSAGAIVLKY